MHSMLSRVLSLMSRKQGSVNADAKVIELLLDSVGLEGTHHEPDADGVNFLGEYDWQSLLQEVQESKEMSHAEINAKRKQLTFKAFSDKNIATKAWILESVVEPGVVQMDRLFKRSRDISQLYHTPRHATEDRAQLASRLPLSLPFCW